MKLSNIFPQIKTDKVQPAKRQEPAANAETVGAAQGDRVNLSSATQDIQRAREVLAQTPAVRSELVEELKGKIERGEYEVDPRTIADKMLKTMISDHRILG